MACVKGVARSASVAFAPDAPYLAAGTMAGAVDLSFSSSSNLEIFRLDFQSDDRELPVVGECPSSERFNRLSWGKNGSGSEEFALGLIAGGFVDGTIDIWNPHSLLSSEEGSSASVLVGHLSKHRGIVRGLEFNTISPNLLASGAEEGEICIWDLASPASPSHFPPLKGSGSASQGELSFLSWNSKVQHILAATSYNGTTVVWDLKKQKPVISFSDSVRRRCSVLQWNPDVATQLVVSSDEDSSPSIKLWDMRNIMTPVKEFIGHTKGVIAMSWCPNDSSYLITCGKDNRTICWDTISGEIVCELPAGTNWNFDVHWFSQMPGVISASSFDGKIGLYNIEGCSRYGLGENDFGTVNLRAPKWYKRPVGASFGFGGKLISFQSKPTSTGATTCYTEVYIHNLVAEHSLVRRSSEFEEAIQNGEKLSLRTLCEKKYSESISEDERETWGFLKIMFEEEGTARTKLLSHLGFSVPTKEDEVVVEKDFEDRDLGQSLSGINVGGKDENAGSKESTLFQLDNGEDFFNNLPSPKADTPVLTSCGILADRGSVSIDEQLQELNGHDEISDLSFDTTIQRALVVGDYKGAVAECISVNKYADALVIAHVGGTVLWENTRDQYLKSSHSAYLKVVNALVNNDLLRLAKMRPLNSWKETLALLCTFARADEWALLCDTLASRLVDVGNTLAATLCYICAGNIDKTVEIWSRSLTYEHGKKPFVELLQDLMERTMVLALATGQKRFSSLLYTLVEKYTEILAGQGLLTTAMEYIKLLGSDELSTELVILRDRIALSTEADTKITSAGNTKPQTEFQYSGGGQPNPALVEPLRSHYPEQSLQQMQQNYSINQYSDNAQPNFSSAYSRGPHGPGQFSTPPQAHSFIPSPVAHEQPGQTPTFGAAPANTNTVTSFIPATPLPLKNARQFQQSTLISQLYPGTIPPYQPSHVPVAPNVSTSATVPRQLMSQVSGTVPLSRGVVPGGVVRGAGFEQGINPEVVKPPVLGPMQPPNPPHPITATQSAVTPPAPPPSIQTADTSNVSANHKPVITTLKRLFNESVEAAGGQRATQMKKREIEDNSRKIGALFERLNCGDISSNASEKLIHLCLALDHADFASALQIQVQLTTSEWDECNFWLATLKRMIKTVQGVRMG